MQVISFIVTEAKALYLALAVDNATIGYFLALHKIQLDLRKVQYLVINYRVSLHLVWSTSTNANQSRLLFKRTCNPRCNVPQI